MAKTFLNNVSQASVDKGGYVKVGYGQVEPNHLSAQRTGQIYAQLPAAASIDVLENGQYVKYDYAARSEGNAIGEVNFTGAGEWMLVYNEIKLYRDGQDDCEFAMLKGNYKARVYSPSTGELNDDAQSRYYGGEGLVYKDGAWEPAEIEKVTAPADPYSLDAVEDPFHIYNQNTVALMPEGTTMVPRVLKTNVGDIYTTNLVMAETLEVGDVLAPNATGILAEAGDDATMKWQVVKVYTMPDGQPGVKIMRIA